MRVSNNVSGLSLQAAGYAYNHYGKKNKKHKKDKKHKKGKHHYKDGGHDSGSDSDDGGDTQTTYIDSHAYSAPGHHYPSAPQPQPQVRNVALNGPRMSAASPGLTHPCDHH
jgi:hypothetical protein